MTNGKPYSQWTTCSIGRQDGVWWQDDFICASNSPPTSHGTRTLDTGRRPEEPRYAERQLAGAFRGRLMGGQNVDAKTVKGKIEDRLPDEADHATTGRNSRGPRVVTKVPVFRRSACRAGLGHDRTSRRKPRCPLSADHTHAALRWSRK